LTAFVMEWAAEKHKVGNPEASRSLAISPTD